MADRLKYRFKHLGVTTAPGYDPTYYVQNNIDNPQSADFTFEYEEATREINRSNSARIVCFGASALYIKAWLIDNTYAAVNSILCEITDMGCSDPGYANGLSLGFWEIKADGLQWCDDAECAYTVIMSQYSPLNTCLDSTLIYDNHRGWFPEDGEISGIDPITGLANDPYMHPRFRYCDDIKPQWVQNFLAAVGEGILVALMTLIGGIVYLFNLIDAIWQFLFNSNLGLSTDLNNMLTAFETKLFDTILGCNRVHPSPFVRNYFVNACSKCGVTFESSIFTDDESQYYYLCHLFAPVRKGTFHTTSQDWIAENHPVYNAKTYAQALAPIFNAKYRMINGVFRFERKDYYVNYLFDFTGADKNFVIGSFCWGWTGKNKPSYQSFRYEQDSFDTDGNTAAHRFNGVAEWNPTGNPLLKGEDPILISGFSSSRYTTDGVEERLAFRALQNNTKTQIGDLLMMDSDITSVGKLIIWDTESDPQDQAETVKVDYTTWLANTGVAYVNDYVNSHPDGYRVFNYPMYYAPAANAFYPNLFEFHKIDDPSNINLSQKQWTVQLDFCCAVIDRLINFDPINEEVTANVDNIVKLPDGKDGVITRISIKYSTGEITLVGKMR